MSSQAIDDIVERVEPVIRLYAAKNEDERQLVPEIMTALIDADIIRCLVPRAYGGLELDVISATQLIEALSHIDAATGWVATICAGVATFLGLFPPEAAEEVFAEPRAVCAGAWFPPGSAEPVPGGYSVTGKWSFGSGSQHATWLTGQAMVMENGQPRIGPSGMPDSLIVFFPARDAKITDNWNTLGMRGTGSNDFAVDQLFVPDHRVLALGPFEPKNDHFKTEGYRLGPWMIPPVQAAVTLGIAQAAIDDLLALAGGKASAYTMTALADRPVVQDKIARARALVEAGRSYVYSSLEAGLEILRTAPKLDPQQGISMALAGSFGIEASAQAVDLVHYCAGTSGIRNERRFQQYFRDVHTLTQHAFSSPGRFESVGKLMLGRESDWPFYYV